MEFLVLQSIDFVLQAHPIDALHPKITKKTFNKTPLKAHNFSFVNQNGKSWKVV